MMCYHLLLVTVEEIESSRIAQKEMYEALEARKRLLEEALKKKTEELKQICLKEGVHSQSMFI